MKIKSQMAAGIILALLLVLLAPVEALALSLKGRVKEFTLKNVMKVLLLERRQSPTL